MISRKYWLTLGLLAGLAWTGSAEAQEVLTQPDVIQIVQQAVNAATANGDTANTFIAVSDREGYILAVYGISGAGDALDFAPVNAIDKAATAAYLSSNGDAFTSRTAGFIIQPHFPPGIANTGTGPLTGVGLSSLPFSDINHFRNPAHPADGIPNTSLSGNAGGVPLYKNGILVGGVGIDSDRVLSALIYEEGGDIDETIAVAAQNGFTAPQSIIATNVLLNGLRLPYTSVSGTINTVATALNPGNYVDPTTLAPPSVPVASMGMPFNTTTPSPFPDIPGGSVRNQIISSALPPVVTASGATGARLTASEVSLILHQGAVRAMETRGAIRSPGDQPAAVFLVVVDYYNPSNPPGTTTGDPSSPPTVVPQVLGSFRTPDATLFSYDVAAQKARTALFFSTHATDPNPIAMSSRCVGFLAQTNYPPGIDGTNSGPYGPPTYGASDSRFGTVMGIPLFPMPYGIQMAVSILPFGGIPASGATVPINKFLPNGITVFPGGFPLYRPNGVLIGAVGVSGDGVDQDDIISSSATVNFEAPIGMRSDQYAYRGARLPYVKFPQNSSL